MAKSKTDHYFEKGQKDAVEGKYRPPHAKDAGFFGLDHPHNDEQKANNDAYKDGHKNATKQKK